MTTFSDFKTHDVINQPSALANFNAYHSDPLLQHYVEVFGGHWGESQLHDYGDKVGGLLQQAGFDANRSKPEFQSHDRFGHRIDQINFHPSYHQLMQSAIEANIHSLPWRQPKIGAHVVRAGLEYLHTQADPGSGCPLTMTFASVAALQHQPALAKAWLPKITAAIYDSRNIPYFAKQGLTIGMAMTEKQGGSDVRANTTKATAIGAVAGNSAYQLIGHKWFCSAPMCDAFLVLAYIDDNLSCFLVPRWRPDGSKNPIQIQRLKSKVGNVSNASAEIEFFGALGWLVGDEGRGVATILEMVALTRFDCIVGSTSHMNQACREALHHTAGRSAFGKPLSQQPLMQNVLADMTLDAEAALAISMRLAAALDSDDRHDKLLFRLGSAIGKYWVCKRTPQLTYEAMECIGGVGVVEDNVLSRLYRDAPINAIWEGSGNIQCLDVLRACSKEPASLVAFNDELARAIGKSSVYDNAYNDYLKQPETSWQEAQLRQQLERMALLWQAATLLQFGEPWVAEQFCLARLSDSSSLMYGALPAEIDSAKIIARAAPRLT
ncbi:acyl-CoA dehydrogenase family protein [Ferrimonas lipolytica]|uniref:DNA alkylation response protein n=1 Tax=Ferrimonas lipolytica TaxID=2724191 RepID=A0A6H1UBW0_9GAMM|nr:acyl-CoA dehydrogenase family protein [Ferrimonas lipolytica]QIZ76070.1 DNA alkylation response protein [Ferrimonas lipolytica]